jgi:serine-type D-Ala-D-Ala carboxypeptidase/endopeptidase (penicillin-binding protein 4)
MMKPSTLFFLLLGWIIIGACHTVKPLVTETGGGLEQKPLLHSAHIGICVYDPARATYLVDYQADKFFVPASNTKLFSLYAGLKWLSDSVPGISWLETDTAILLVPRGDPTFLHHDYPSQPVSEFLKSTKKTLYLTDAAWQEEALGPGWAWNDYNEDYMVERSPLPVYGNVVRWIEEKESGRNQGGFDSTISAYSIPEINWKVEFSKDTGTNHFYVRRRLAENEFELTLGKESHRIQEVPFVTNGMIAAIELLKDTIGREIKILHYPVGKAAGFRTIYSRPVDSLFRPMMYRSDNFFAEQTLLMVGFNRLGMMNQHMIIDTLLRTDLKDLPESPRWVDGSGLSRYNLFTPKDFVWLLDRMKNEFGWERMKSLLPTGSRGTLGNYFKQDSGFIFAKTGSLSGVITLSGYLITMKNHLLIFSVLVNNYNGNGTALRKEVEAYLHDLREKN